MLEIVPTKSFKKDILKEVYDVISTLSKDESLHYSKKDHRLVGNYGDYRECHVKNGVLLFIKSTRRLIVFT